MGSKADYRSEHATDAHVCANLAYLAARDPAEKFRGYYFSLEPTGCEPVDALLAAIAGAATDFHHTSDWAEYGWAETIQRVANAAAAAFLEGVRDDS